MKQFLEFQISHRTPKNSPKETLLRLVTALEEAVKDGGEVTQVTGEVIARGKSSNT